MSIQNYLNNKESILFGWDISPKGELNQKTGKTVKTKVNKLGITNKRVFQYTKLKGNNRIYRDIPLKEISYIENVWHARNILFLILGIILLIIGLITLMYFIGILFFILGIVLIVKGAKCYGYLMINGDDWKFRFNKTEDIIKIEQFIREVYFIKNEIPIKSKEEIPPEASPVPNMNFKFCHSCGTKINKVSTCCERCGTKQ